jgi:hypothetical protein
MIYTIPAENILEILKSTTEGKGGKFTLKSKKTLKEYTYKIDRSLFKQKWYSNIFVEINYLEFLHLGYYSNGYIIKKGLINDSPSATSIAFVLYHLENDKVDFINSKTEIYHLGKCLKCGKTLTDSYSIERGLGPYCRSVI